MGLVKRLWTGVGEEGKEGTKKCSGRDGWIGEHKAKMRVH